MTRKGTCKSCIFTEVCDAKMRNCNDYYSIDEDDTQIIENGRDEFYGEWFSYIKEYDDDVFY